MKIAVDTLGSDFGSKYFVPGILDFLKANPDVEVVAFGNKEELKELEGKCEIVDAPDIVPMEAGPLEVLHARNSSMCQAIKQTKENGYDAVVSAGSTGGFLSASTLTLKLIPGIKRAAFVAPFPTFIKGKKMVVLDVGASNENSKEELYQFALMGQLYAQSVFGVKEPQTYLLSNGTEDHKGSPTVQEANKYFREVNLPYFCGNKEARDALDGSVDVLVCDGFSGNIFLKSNEGMAKFMAGMIKKAFKKNLWSKLGYLHVRKGINEISETMDYKSTGGAMLLGINSVVVKCHGNSDAYSITNALRVAKALAEAKIVEKIREGLK
ncbi:MAG: phosphate acyltransferase PlsX [Bacilli bacterium]|nr:phosphate acyltransferase PlsX [Bacilli bacterium]